MSIRNLEWTKGAPERLEPGMVVLIDNCVLLVGNASPSGRLWGGQASEEDLATVDAWAWLVKPHTLEWIADMAKAHGVGR
ncbi:hypothetical protein ACFSKY_00030 [Azotobacter chroococcum]|uniref:Uncharacterized protein n=1 Tax=Azotobacter chroococcum TaxID=353 RepID=A0A4R1PR70_9GAMM|nr:hypothetical protein [Azotobacter chroococcum]TBV95948.1 hypothetical protein E0E53_12110 [Azotobacter chroococcum]TCL26837.1 hypothetical protein EV691_12943 [Azotobacter chroococcum]